MINQRGWVKARGRSGREISRVFAQKAYLSQIGLIYLALQGLPIGSPRFQRVITRRIFRESGKLVVIPHWNPLEHRIRVLLEWMKEVACSWLIMEDLASENAIHGSLGFRLENLEGFKPMKLLLTWKLCQLIEKVTMTWDLQYEHFWS